MSKGPLTILPPQSDTQPATRGHGGHGTSFVGHHQQIDHALQQLYTALPDADSQDEPPLSGAASHRGHLRGLLVDLWEAAATHFAHEEKLMEDTGFLQADEHRHAHQMFLTLLRMELQTLDSAPGQFRPDILCQSLGSWLASHSRLYDADLTLFLCKGGR